MKWQAMWRRRCRAPRNTRPRSSTASLKVDWAKQPWQKWDHSLKALAKLDRISVCLFNVLVNFTSIVLQILQAKHLVRDTLRDKFGRFLFVYFGLYLFTNFYTLLQRNIHVARNRKTTLYLCNNNKYLRFALLNAGCKYFPTLH
jgi:hypothetical protein